jgi:hypothetical protein
MSLPKTQWRYLGVVSCNSATTTTIIDGIYNLGLVTTYPDGSARTPGSGSAGTYNLVSTGTTRVLHIDPSVRTINNKIVLCADTGGTISLPNGAARLPTTASGEDVFADNKSGSWWGSSGSTGYPAVDGVGRFTIFSTIIKNPGVYSHWTAVNPFTSGSFYGYYRSLVTTSSGFTGSVHVYESSDCLAVAFVGSQNYFLLAGAIIDPESPDTTLDSESDGKLYGIITATFGSGWIDNIVSNLQHTGVSSMRNQMTSSIFLPNSSNILRITPITWTVPVYTFNDIGRYNSSTNLLAVSALNSNLLNGSAMFTRSGRLVKIPITYRSLTSGHTLGRLRDIYLFSNSRLPRRLMNGNVPLGYAFGPSDSSDVNCLFMEH